MNKQEFLSKLKSKLCGLPQKEIDERISFYSEMIDDRKEDGLSEEDAINQIGSVDEIAKQIINDTKKANDNSSRVKKRPWYEAILIVIGAPIWLSLIVSVYVVIWSVVISLWSAELSFVIGTVAGVLGGIIYVFINTSAGFILIGTGILLAGLSIIAFFICKYITKFLVYLTAMITKLIKNSFARGEKNL